MSMPFYVSPEQLTKDRAEFARKGISRGRSVLAASCREGILFVAENPSPTLHKIAEIHDRIGFAGVGKYHEFETLRVAGVRYADLRGYAYDRTDVTARALAGTYAQTLGATFAQDSKPFEVEILLAQVGTDPTKDEIYRISYDGSVRDEPRYAVSGGAAERVTTALREQLHTDLPMHEVIAAASTALRREDIPPAPLEIALLDRTRPRRTFRRLDAVDLPDLRPRSTNPQTQHSDHRRTGD
ncbi:proteasome alpha subunit [Austwickia chelonae]|uniref:20S proteasome alpha-type subunit n=1 Tax=Austwickia chelonae NBRC 105200 TaxID=1184607 RepID=K6W5Q8_9MICO|nr:proteasome subunit alpha [Austwickia chelonae]GAB77157.1 20S proteasome alpha-type subunit [Austwickia chelonae NBRC 105200]SEW04078.1 proteasome alpha subunit [Austwickia chelonae]